MSDIVSPLLQWLNANPEYSGLATFVISAAESVAIIGTIVPGSITMTAIGALAGAGVIPLWETIIWAMAGAVVGDGISYWIGHYYKSRLPHIWPFKYYPGFLKNGQKFVHKYGYMSVFIGRFVGPVRAIVPLIAGMLGMKPFRFYVANVTSAILWAPAYMLPGILLGAASLELPPDIAFHVVLVLLLIGLFILLVLWIFFKIIQLFVYHTTNMQEEIWHWLKKSRYFSFVTVLLSHHEEAKTRSQLGYAFYFLDAAILFVVLAVYVKIKGAPNIAVNDALYHLFRGIRGPRLDSIMLHLTFLGQKEIILPLVLTVSGWLYYINRKRAAFHTLALGVLAGGSIFVIKHLTQNPRPWGILESPETYSMPSGHVTIATTIYMGLAFLIASNMHYFKQRMIYGTAVMLILAISISRLYLGAHWFTDVLGAWLLATSILMFIIISYGRKKSPKVPAKGLILVSLITLTLTYSVFNHFSYAKLTRAYSQIDYPIVELTMNDWWNKNDGLPAYRASLFGFPTHPINIEWVGDLNKIENTLKIEGWMKPPARDFIGILHRIADIKSTQYLSLISPQYLDKSPELTLVRQMPGSQDLVVIRFWDSSRRIIESNKVTPLWVGIVDSIPRSYSWLTRTHVGYLEIDPTLVFPLKTGMKKWEWKIIQIRRNQAILILRPNK